MQQMGKWDKSFVLKGIESRKNDKRHPAGNFHSTSCALGHSVKVHLLSHQSLLRRCISVPCIQSSIEGAISWKTIRSLGTPFKNYKSLFSQYHCWDCEAGTSIMAVWILSSILIISLWKLNLDLRRCKWLAFTQFLSVVELNEASDSWC